MSALNTVAWSAVLLMLMPPAPTVLLTTALALAQLVILAPRS